MSPGSGPGSDDFVAGDLVISRSDAAGVIRLDWKGKSNNREPAKLLQPFFADIVADIVKAGAATKSTVEMHFEKLEHFNSSTITALIQFIQTSRSAGVPLVICYDASLKWQRLSFDALRIFEKSDKMLTLQAR
jgi:hypothetical protein